MSSQVDQGSFPPIQAHSRTLELKDGRKLGYATYGQLVRPRIHVLYFHGMPGSRLEPEAFNKPALRLHVQIIGVDRPGVGLSSPHPRRRLLDFVSDILQLIDELQIEAVHLLGTSAGAAYALACAQFLPSERIEGLGLIAPWILGVQGAGVQRKLLNLITVWLPETAIRKVVDWTLAGPSLHPDPKVLRDLYIEGFTDGPSDVEKELAKDQESMQIMVENEREAFKQGSQGVAQESRLQASPWGFETDKLSDLPTCVWLGEEDAHIPLDLGRNAAAALRHPQVTEFQADTHYTIIPRHAEEILTKLVEGR